MTMICKSTWLHAMLGNASISGKLKGAKQHFGAIWQGLCVIDSHLWTQQERQGAPLHPFKLLATPQLSDQAWQQHVCCARTLCSGACHTCGE